MSKVVKKKAIRALAVESLERRQLMAVTPAIVDGGGELTLSNYYPRISSDTNSGGFLTRPSKSSASSIAGDYLAAHASDFNASPLDITLARITNQYTDPASNGGVTHVYYQQTYNGLPVTNTSIVVNVLADGSVVSAAGGFVGGLDQKQTPPTSFSPAISSDQALTIAAAQLKLGKVKAATRLLARATGKNLITKLSQPSFSQDTITASLEYVPKANGVELSWDLTLRTAHTDHWYNVGVGTASSAVVFANDYVDNASYNVIARPATSPTDGGFSVLTDPADPLASPYGWHDTNGVAGAEFTDTRGNNVDAHLDRNNDNVADASPPRPDGGSTLNFSGYTQDPTQAPTVLQNQNIAQVNLFYLNNLLHDVHYKYGFTEAAGNFQTNNYGRGGTGNDAVQADAQDGGGTDNANFATPPDGSAGRMQMYLFTATTPGRDGDLDAEVIDHEYGHGVSNRLTGGPANANALTAIQSGGMGEGWSDFYSLMFEQKASDGINDGYPVGTYVEGNTAGIRRKPYSYNLSIDPLTIDAFGTSGTSNGVSRSTEVHNTGELWCEALWDVNWLLINKYGFDPNIQNGYSAANPKGNTLALQLVMNGMKLQPANPSFKDARDAIYAADQALNGGADLQQLYAAFARRGMGDSFVDASSSATSVTAAYDLPVADPVVVNLSPGTSMTPISAVTFTFNQAMNTSSFSIASDLVSFTGPGGTNLLPTVSGFSWTSSTTLQVNFATTSTTGTYTMVIGPNINAADDGHAMDQNKNGVPGEAADIFTGTFAYNNFIGPDGFGYKTAPFPYENLDLAIGGTGVTTLINGADDSSVALPLGTNTFSFYGTTYTGATSLYVNSNGLISLGVADTSYSNTDLTSSPTEPVIAPLWDDWTTGTNATGATDSAVLYRFDTAANRLVIEWSDIVNYNSSTSGFATFQAILQLNTGSTPGRIIYNYPNLASGSGTADGVSATVGIKATGTQGANRLITSVNATSTLVGAGKALLTALDVTAPTVASTFNYLTGPSVSMTFSKDVGASLSVADLTLVNTTTNTIIPASALALAYNSGTRVGTLTFPGYPGGTLPNGNYTLTLSSAGITDAVGNPLDGDNDGIIGGDARSAFYWLTGDANRDRKVDVIDLGMLSSNWQATGRNYAAGDFNYDGKVDVIDLGMLSSNWQVGVAAPAGILDAVAFMPDSSVAAAVLQ